MKKVLSIAVIALAFASCKKDYTCTCVSTATGSSLSVTNVYVIKGVSKGTAKKACVDKDYKNSAGTVTGSDACTLSK